MVGRFFKALLACVTSVSLSLPLPLWAQTSQALENSNATSEYVFRSTYKENMIPVQVMGAVGKPGLYFVPAKTDLVKLLTVAGGPDVQADEESIVVRKADPAWASLEMKGLKKDKQAYNVNFKKLLREDAYSGLAMSPNDVVFVPAKSSWISSGTARTVSVISLVMGIVLTGLLIDQKSK